MYPESNIENMMNGYKAALDDDNPRRASEIRRFLKYRKVMINDDLTWYRKR